MAVIWPVQDDSDGAERLVLDHEHHRSRKVRVEKFGGRHEQPAGCGHRVRIPAGQSTEPPETSVIVFLPAVIQGIIALSSLPTFSMGWASPSATMRL